MNRWAPALSRIVIAGGLMLASIGVVPAAGALAIGACGAYGAAYDYRGDEAARGAALKKCSGDCKVVSSLKRSCAAFAIDGHKPCGALGYAAAPRLGMAQNAALKYCRNYDATGRRHCGARLQSVVTAAAAGNPDTIRQRANTRLD